MRIPITPDGYRILLFITLSAAAIGFAASLLSPWAWLPIAILWTWAIAFFRDPARNIPRQPHILYAPADGHITDVTRLDHHPLIPGPCIRIRIFLSLFNAHINRMPCAAKVESITYQPGRFLNAMKPESAEHNESSTLLLSPAKPFAGPMVVRQIAGLVARRIVCHARADDAFDAGQRFGMIKFGSGTELIVPDQPGLTVHLRVGDPVKAGLTELIKLDMMRDSS